jgi:TolB-like protein/DNA-binding winged helix-turn-helix (wHTH) protein/Tfp pilus assembly protein PilF
MNNQGKELYEFGPFRLDPGKRLLLRNNQPVPLQMKAFETLLVLVRNSEKVVLKDDLIKEVWPGTFVEESNLAQNIFVLRKTLGETVGDHRYIVTIPGRGYRFVGEVTTVLAEMQAHDQLIVSGHSRSRLVIEENKVRRKTVTSATLVVLLLGATVLLAVGGFRTSWKTRERKFESFAVLPFRDISSDSSDQYLSDGVTDELITQLAQISTLHVISHTSSMKYKSSNKLAPRIGRELGVDVLVEGTVEHVGNRVRVSVHLIDAAKDRYLWARSYDREVKDVLLLQSDAAHDIALEIEGNPQLFSNPSHPVKVRPVNPEAYEAYLRGQYFLAQRSRPSIGKSLVEFKRAVDLDAGYAAAHAGLAHAYLLAGNYDVETVDPFLKARAAAEKALSLDDSIAIAHAVLAQYFLQYEYNFPAAGREYQRAVRLDPSDVTVRSGYARNYLAFTGRLDEALAEMKQAVQIDPLSLSTKTSLGLVYYFRKDYDNDIAMCRKALEVDPNFLPAHVQLVGAYLAQRRYPEYIAEYRITQKWDPPSAGYLPADDLQKAYEISGAKGMLRVLQHSLEHLSPDYGAPVLLAGLYADQGDKDRAFHWLEKAYQQRDSELLALKVDPFLDSLHSDPRFGDLVRRLGLPQ